MWGIFLPLIVSVTLVYGDTNYVTSCTEVSDNNNECKLVTMATNSCEIPPKRPKVETDYELCIKCQLPDMDTDIVRSRESSYEHFLRCVRIRADYQDLDYISIYDSLRDASAESLRQSKAVWHSKCYSETTNKTNIERARTRHEKAISLEDTVVVSEDALQDKLSELKFQNLVDEFDTINDKYPNYRWIRMYMRQVLTPLQFLRSIRLRQWDLFLASLEQLCIWFFAYNRLDYALNIPEYIARMYKIEDTHPDVWQEFEEGGFTVNTNHVPFTAIGVDQAQEHVNKFPANTNFSNVADT